MGVFLSFDLFLFYLFWELMLVPMLFLIGVWGHGQRIYSAVKFFLVTFVGSLLMLIAIIGLHLIHQEQTGLKSFAFTELLNTHLSPALSIWLFAAFLLSFAIKIPLIPVHTWLPDAHTDAPTAGSVVLAGLLLKTGAYGLLRFAYPLFPSGATFWTPTILVLSVAGIIYASWIAYAQTDIKRLVAYSSVGHMGFVALGIAAWTPVSLSGSILQMVNHGVTTGALFAMVGMLDERGHSRDIKAYGGLWGKIPAYSVFFLLFAVSSVGLPGLNNFVGEFLVLVGAFGVAPLAVVFAFFGIVLPLVYMTRLVQELLFTSEHRASTFSDLNGREYLILISLAVADLFVGVHPDPLLHMLALPVKLLTSSGGTP
jgi:NADH-quinone oxidoreductase subunit M